MKVLFYATYPNQPIGYSKVAHVLSQFLADHVEVVYMGLANYPQLAIKERPLDSRIRYIDVLAERPKGSTEEYGVDFIQDVLLKEKPDVFFIYNDIIVTCRLYNQLAEYKQTHRTKFVSYLDLVYPFERAEFIRHVNRFSDLIFVFSDCWKTNLITMGVPGTKVRVLPHGFNASLFRSIPKEEARNMLGIDPNDFVFLNTNRNTYRKAHDITLGGFLHCLVKEQFDPRLKLFLNCALKTGNGYDIIDIIEVECLKRGLPFDQVMSHILTFPENRGGNVSDEMINALYRGTNVGINSCTGEGFGLCSMEHAALGIPQIVSAVGALKDIFKDGGAIVVEPRVWIHTTRALDEHTGEQGICSAEDFGEAMSLYFRNTTRYAKDATYLREHMAQRYHWPTILAQFQKDFNDFFAK